MEAWVLPCLQSHLSSSLMDLAPVQSIVIGQISLIAASRCSVSSLWMNFTPRLATTSEKEIGWNSFIERPVVFGTFLYSNVTRFYWVIIYKCSQLFQSIYSFFYFHILNHMRLGPLGFTHWLFLGVVDVHSPVSKSFKWCVEVLVGDICDHVLLSWCWDDWIPIKFH